MKNFVLQAWLSLVIMAIVMALLIFIPAGTIDYWQAWLFLAAFFAPTILLTADLVRRDPALLQRRMKGGPTAEKETFQKILMVFASLAFIGMLIVPALDHRFGWSHIPLALELAGNVAIVIGFYIVFRVFRANTFTASTIQIAEGQTVISTGPYAIVRHPMYSGALLYSLGMSLALGSWWGLIAFGTLALAIVFRLFDEERMLRKNLPGYTKYCENLKWRLVPGVF